MIIVNGIERLRKDLGRVIVTMGNFDGFHIGHRKIVDRVLRRGKALHLKTVVMTFDPHPSHVISPSSAPKLIQTRHQKIRILEETGIDVLLFIPFNRDISLLTAEEFFDKHIGKRIKIEEIYVGENFRLGKNRSADSKTLSALSHKFGFKLGVIESVILDGDVISSSLIRKLIDEGNVERASRLLGHPFSIEGEVVSGQGIGRRMKLPTANVHPENELIPHMGVYITESVVSHERFTSVTNIGVRPTFNLYTSAIETHLINFRSTIYGEDIEIFFYKRIRDEMKFDDVERLKKQIERDIKEAEAFFGTK